MINILADLPSTVPDPFGSDSGLLLDLIQGYVQRTMIDGINDRELCSISKIYNIITMLRQVVVEIYPKDLKYLQVQQYLDLKTIT